MKIKSRTILHALLPGSLSRNSIRPLPGARSNGTDHQINVACFSWLKSGFGLLTFTGIAALLGAEHAQAGNGVHINANADGECVSINDPQGNTAATVAANVTFRDAASGKCNSSNKGSQTDSVLFYRPAGSNGVGATSLTLGGELYVNSGKLMLGNPVNLIMIGNERTLATGNGAAIGMGARATGANSIAAGFEATSAGVNASSYGYQASALGDWATAIGASAKAAGERAVAAGAGASASGGGSFAGARDANAQGEN